jgi:gas vesicle protein
MNAHIPEHRDYGFAIGLLTGTCVGAALAMWLAPRSTSEFRRRMTDSARKLGNRASEGYQQASTRIGVAVDELTRKGQDVRDDMADVVARSAHEVARNAHEVERYATAIKSDRAPDVAKHAAGDRLASRTHSL